MTDVVSKPRAARNKRAAKLREDPSVAAHGSAYTSNAYLCRDDCPGDAKGVTCRQAHAADMKARRAAAKHPATSED